MLIAVVFAVLALALWFPETPIGGALSRLLIDEPARRLDKLNRGHVLLAIVIFTALAAAYAIARETGVLLAGQATADGLAYAMALDFATWLDITAIAVVMAATMRFREAIRRSAVRARQWAMRCTDLPKAALASFARSRARRARPTRRPRQPEDSDGPAPDLAWA